ncbi:MAG TPA: hypothetical protein ENI74_09770 [Gammaproteobacteria bacterium]|nr:hypothetical protein [Gammaproteobacteria bacterium]
MEDLQINLFVLLGVLEFAMAVLVVALFFIVRSKRLASRVRVLQQELAEVGQEDPAAIGFEQYLRDEILRNQSLIDSATASTDDAEKKAGELLQLRKQFLELEVEVRSLEKNPVAFQDKLAAGMSELIERLRPEPEIVTETVSEAADEDPAVDAAAEADIEEEVERVTVDTHDAEMSRLRDVINNQQDAMVALRQELESRESEFEGMGSILQKLDEFERQSADLENCLGVLEQENERLKTARAAGEQGSNEVDVKEPVQLGGLKSMMSQQQDTISNLQNLIQELAPEAGKAKQLEEAINSITRTNKELNGCVTVLEDENTKLHSELEQIQTQLEQQAAQLDAAQEDASVGPVDVALDDTAEADSTANESDEEKQELEIKVQELEALVEFKDAAIEELEKQYNTLESKYVAMTGEKSTG